MVFSLGLELLGACSCQPAEGALCPVLQGTGPAVHPWCTLTVTCLEASSMMLVTKLQAKQFSCLLIWLPVNSLLRSMSEKALPKAL